MSRKSLLALCFVFGLFMASNAMALETPGIAAFITDHLKGLGLNSGNTSGTILNPEGKGDALIFPYFDVREIATVALGGTAHSQNTYFAIINTEPDRCEGVTTNCYAGIAAKLRFREWDKSLEVFDCDIWLSRGDVWVGGLSHNTAIALPYGTVITSGDYVITSPATGGCPGGANATFAVDNTLLAGGFAFPNTVSLPVGPPASSNLFGYFEVIGTEMTYDHQSAGLVSRLPTCPDAENTLVGYAYLVRVDDASSFGYNAKAIANFSRNQGTLFGGAGGTLPTLEQCEDSLDQLEFVLSKEEIFGGYSVETSIAGKFSLILTFPTKHFHFCGYPDFTSKSDPTAPLKCITPTAYPFGPPWVVAQMNLPETVAIQIWDRDEHVISPPTIFYSPQPPTTPNGLPFEVSIIGLYLGSPPVVPAAGNRDNLAVSTVTFDKGYVVLNFPETNTNPKPGNNFFKATGFPLTTAYQFFGTFFHSYDGLPVLGLTLQEFFNTLIQGAAYGDIRDVFYNVEWYGGSSGMGQTGMGPS